MKPWARKGEGNAMSRHSQDIDRLVGLRVAQLRQTRGLSQTALADQLGVSFQQVQKYEKGLNRISASRLFHLAEVLDCSIADLFPERSGVSDLPVGLTGLLASAEGRSLASSFAQIADPLVRQALSRIAVALAKA